MTDALYKLQSWLSPSYPVGAYAFSHGLETAAASGLVSSTDDAGAWIASLVTDGNGFADLVFLSAAWDAAGDAGALAEVLDEALAFQSTSELRTESTAQGDAFLRVTEQAWPCAAASLLREIAEGPLAYPVVVGAIAASHRIDKHDAMIAYGHAFTANLVSAAVRLIPLGQTDGQRLIAGLLDSVQATATRAATTALEDVATSTPMADITSMQHETQYTRLFRS